GHFYYINLSICHNPSMVLQHSHSHVYRVTDYATVHRRRTASTITTCP
ncbi:unnamed protein product, partial [Brassica rapa]